MSKSILKKIGIIVVILIVILVAYNLIGQIFEATRSGDRLSKEAEELYKLEAENKELKKKLSESKSVQFLEEQARDKLGLAKKGETVVVISEDKLKQVLGATESAKEARLPNPLGWWRVFFP